MTVEEKFSVRLYFSKMKGAGKSPLQAIPLNALWGLIGGFITIGILAYLTQATASPWLMAPFGASCVLAFGVWDSPLSQPRNIIGGHLVSTSIGILCHQLFGNHLWVLALAVGLAIALMHLTKTTHPPAGADPLTVILGGHDWAFLVTPVLVGAVIIALVALLFNNLHKNRRYPTFWV
jgi:CBS-domain-containing membrane protein